MFEPVNHYTAVNLCSAVMIPSLRKDASLITCAFIGVMSSELMKAGFEVAVVGSSLETTFYDKDIVDELLDFAKYLTSEAEVEVTVAEYFKYIKENQRG